MKSRADEVNIRVCDVEATLKSYLLDKKKCTKNAEKQVRGMEAGMRC